MEASQKENSKRIAKNTLVLYVRMLFSMLVSLYTSRVVLNTLGVEDYGIYNVVGGFVAMFSLISSSLSSSTSRFLTFELGKGDLTRLKRVFSTSLSIHLILIGVVLLLMETVGIWFLNHKMTIPAERMFAANCVFQASAITFAIGLISVPYNSSIIAHERMSAFAYIGILDVVLRLLIILFIAYSPYVFDKLIIYALLLVCMGILIQSIYWNYCKKHFTECRVNPSFDKQYWKEMSAFAGWNFIGCSAGLLSNQGINILLNLFGGPILNAARGIAMNVNTAVTSFSGNFMMALNPQITKSYAQGEREYMFSLVERGARFSFYIMLLLSMPILFETDFILTIWLKQYPAHTVNFVRLVLLLSLCDILSNTLITLQTATGKIRDYQLAVGGMLIMNFPLSYLCLKLGYPPESTLFVALGVAVSCLLLRLYFLKQMVNISIRRYLKNVCFNVLSVSCIALCLPILAFWVMPEGWMRFIVVSILCILSVSTTTYRLGCTQAERQFIIQKVKRVSPFRSLRS